MKCENVILSFMLFLEDQGQKKHLTEMEGRQGKKWGQLW